MNVKNKKTVYFLGVGATKEVEPRVSVGGDLIKNALTHFADTDEAKKIKGFIFNVFKDHKIHNEEDIWNLLDYIIYRNESLSAEYDLQKVHYLRNKLISLLIRELESTLRDSDNLINNNFIKKINHGNSTIISTNYDILIDNALSHVSNHDYGVKIRKSIIGESDSADGLKRPGSYLVTTLNTGSIPLLKLHGSLNWLYCPKCDEVDISVGEKGVIKVISETGYYCWNKSCTNKYEYLLITPTMFKNYENRIIKDVWKIAERKLIEANQIVFIGYSLPSSDYYIRCLLLRSLANRSALYEKVIVVEKETADEAEKNYVLQVKKRYEDIFGLVEFMPIGFKKFVDELLK